MSQQQVSQTLSGVKIWIDKDFLQSTKGAGEMLSSLQSNNVNCIIDKLPVRNSLFWTRDDAGQEVQHDHILVRVDWEFFIDASVDFVSNRAASELARFVEAVKASSKCTNVTLLVFEFKKSWKNIGKSSSDKSSRSKTTRLSKSDLSEILIALELEDNVQVRSYEDVGELKELVMSFTKAIAEYTSKHSSLENALFSENAVEKAQTKIGKDGQNLIHLWKELIQSFPMVSADQAQAICAVYPSPLLLKQAYDKASHSEANMLLADIQVRRGAGVLSNVRRIGPELSQKIYKFLTSTKADELLVNN